MTIEVNYGLIKLLQDIKNSVISEMDNLGVYSGEESQVLFNLLTEINRMIIQKPWSKKMKTVFCPICLSPDCNTCDCTIEQLKEYYEKQKLLKNIVSSSEDDNEKD